MSQSRRRLMRRFLPFRWSFSTAWYPSMAPFVTCLLWSIPSSTAFTQRSMNGSQVFQKYSTNAEVAWPSCAKLCHRRGAQHTLSADCRRTGRGYTWAVIPTLKHAAFARHARRPRGVARFAGGRAV